MSNLKGNKEETRINAPYHNQFYRIADMLATSCADKRVDSLSTMCQARGFTEDEINGFVETWLTTQSKFPVLADIYQATGKPKIKMCECNFFGIVESEYTDYSNDEHMARIIFLNECLDRCRQSEKLCCFLYREYTCNDTMIRLIKNLIADSKLEIKTDFIESEYKLVEYRLQNNGKKQREYYQIPNRNEKVKHENVKKMVFRDCLSSFQNERGCQD